MRSPAIPPPPRSSRVERRGGARAVVLREAVAGLLLFGVVATRPDIEQSGNAALAELRARGYSRIGADAPVRIYALAPGSEAEPNQAALWRPGVISLRLEPAGTKAVTFYLRHELMHEASHRTCRGGFPLWAEEAAAIAFAGVAEPGDSSSESDLERLRESARLDRPLDAVSYRALERLVARHGWPREPCAVSAEIGALMRANERDAPLHYVLISVASGRILETAGDTRSVRWPPGSLLKIPFAAALDVDDPHALGRELARSDTEALVRRLAALRPERWRRLLTPIADLRLPERIDEGDARAWLGERRSDGAYATEATLEEIALVLRASLLSKPDHFEELRRNGELSGSTLAPAPAAARAVLARLDALAKTGTLSNARGDPIAGYLMVAWPVPRPSYLAVFRRRGVRGVAVLSAAKDRLVRWREQLVVPAEVRVRLLSLVDAGDVRIEARCPRLEIEDGGRVAESSTCGDLRVLTDARGALPERSVRGWVERTPAGWILTTDAESYADGVVDAEAADLRGSARAALRAVVVWNGLRGARSRHAETAALCDSTHCMVFRGTPAAGGSEDDRTDWALVRALDDLARSSGAGWLAFSQGGTAPWSRTIGDRELARSLREPVVLEVARERVRDGSVVFHLTYAESAETVPCEALRGAIHLPGCPARVYHSSGGWTFEGVGEGHGLGLDVERARALSREGKTALEILRDAYATSR